MADLSVTVADVKPGAGASTKSGIAGTTITAGQALYKDPVTGKLLLAKALGAAVEAQVVGVSRHAALADQPIDYQDDGDIEGMGTTEGLVYILSTVAGGISPHTDVSTPASTEFVSLIGVGGPSGKLSLGIFNSGHQLA